MWDEVKIDFGKVVKYIEERGFGFVSHSFVGSPSREVFFHIKNVKRTHPQLAQALNNPSSHEALYFWYAFEESDRGQQVIEILDPKKIGKKYPHEASALKEIIEKEWMNAEVPLPELTIKAAFDLLPPDEVRRLEKRRGILEVEKKKECQARQRAEIAKLEEIANQQAAQEIAEKEEFRQLVAEMSALGFTHSKQVSAYIVRHRLGYKYQHISGILQMEMEGNVWNFNGGFPPKVYARLCEELKLGNQGSRAKPVAFTSYRDINAQ
jgi:cold shock CspA family protein